MSATSSGTFFNAECSSLQIEYQLVTTSAMSNYLDAADTDDEDDKCTSIANPEDIAIAQERCRVLKGDLLHLICIYSTGEEES